MVKKSEYKSFIRQRAYDLGFSYIGFAKAEELTEEAKRLEAWLSKGYHGQMHYMENYFDLRTDPRKLVPGAKTVVTMMFNYFPEKEQTEAAPKIARYAYGKDYHFVLKRKLKDLLQSIQGGIGEVDGRCFVDSAPIMEREWAKRSGVGWHGKNTLIINPKSGSYFFLACLVIDLEIEPDPPIKDYCGTCTKCIDACPTDAISEKGYLLDASKCISYLTIELKESIPTEFKGKMEDWMFGCDICQEVCPWNRFSQKNEEEWFEPHPDLLTMNHQDWEEITEETFRKVFKKSAVKRTKYAGLKRNIEFLGR